MGRFKRRLFWAQLLYHPNVPQFTVVTCVILVFTLLMVWLSSDSCGSWKIAQNLCDQYEKGLVAGSLCYSICRERNIYFGHCWVQENGQKVFSFENILLKVPEELEWSSQESEHFHSFPAEGSTIAEFRSAIRIFLQLKLGEGATPDLLDNLLYFADFNNNQQISLAEARSLWSLLQIHDFLMLYVFRHTKDHIHRINGTCGSLYAVDQVSYTYLYQKKSNLFQTIFPNSYRWTLPSWKYRAKIAVGLLDFVFTVYEYEGVFFNLCRIHPLNLGYTNNYEFRALDLTDVFSGAWLKHKIRNISCNSDSDCSYTPHCSTICDRTTWQCSGRLLRPNLSLVCEIFQDYIQPDAPREIRSELDRLLTKCLKLDNHLVGAEMKHIVLLNDMFTLIFGVIRYDTDPLL